GMSLSDRGISNILDPNSLVDITAGDHTNKYCCTKRMKHLSLLAFLFLVSCSDSLVERFRDCCAAYHEPGFETRLSILIPVGASSEKFDELLAIADKIRRNQSSTEYIFSDATGAFSEQGLVIMISVDHSTETITTVESAVASN
ncbi:MAG TPA: hypothetical protein PK529_09165, partial [Verrucomicrobiales bacterium]|nr:hypothetical protein [Verrucomicrobiales bacterium]